MVVLHSALIELAYQAAKATVAATHPAPSNGPQPAERLYRTLEACFFKGYPRAFQNETVPSEHVLALTVFPVHRVVHCVLPVAQLLASLQGLLGGERSTSEERVRGRIAHALGRIGPGAVAAIPELLALLEDEAVYRDTRFYAKRALVAIGPEAAQALFEELRATPRWAVLAALSEMRAETLTNMVGLAGLLEALRSGEDEGLQGISAAILHKPR